MLNKKYTYFFVGLFASLHCPAQKTHQLDTAQIFAQRILLTTLIDSSAHGATEKLSDAQHQLYGSLNYFRLQSLGGSFSLIGSGISAIQSQVFWNGIALQNPMHASVDLSLVDFSLFDNYAIYNQSSPMLMNSSFGNALDLKQKKATKNTSVVSARFSDMNNTGINLTLNRVYSNLVSSTKIGLDYDQNAYRYKDLSDQTKTRTHTYFHRFSANQRLAYSLSSTHSIQAELWYTKSERSLPKSIAQVNLAARQKDEALRANISLQSKHNKFENIFQVFSLIDHIHFIDTNSSIDAPSKSMQFGFKNLLQKQTKHFTHHLDLNYTYIQAQSNNYEALITNHRIYGLLSTAYSKNKFNLQANLGIERQYNRFADATYGITLDYKPSETISFALLANKTFRFPSINDLYWNPGGNINLNPESGLESKLFIRMQKPLFSLSITPFYRLIQDYIAWQPSGIIFSPINLDRLEAYGVEAHFDKVFLKTNRLMIKQTIGLNYTAPDIAFMPKTVILSTLRLALGNTAFTLFYRYNDQVYTLLDFSEKVDAYHLLGAHIDQSFDWRDKKLIASVFVDNLTNISYASRRYYPMPLRNFNCSLTLKF